MTRYANAPDPSDTTASAPTKERLWDDLRDLFHECHHTTEQARYFVQAICSPYDPRHEKPYRRPVAGAMNNQRWEEPYRARLMQCAAIYLRMSQQDRSMLHAGAEDGVYWRGEPVSQYVDIVDETLLMRQMGLRPYRTEAAQKLNAVLAGKPSDAA